MTPEGTVAGNHYGKYETRNPIARAMVSGFRRNFRSLAARTGARTVLEVGCGEGWLLAELQRALPGAVLRGADLSAPTLREARTRAGDASLAVMDAERLAVRNDAADLIVCCEVLEHLEDPSIALRELERITARWLIASVPREPLWRALNMARGSYWHDLGNTPGHLNHWGSRAFVRLLSRHFRVVERRQPIPWTMLLLERL